MPPVRPMLGDVELQHVQQIEVDGDQVLVQHGVPALEGDFLQGLGRRARRVTISGVLLGAEAGEGLRSLREQFRAAAPVSFVADITTATQVGQVLIEELGVRALAGKPERFEYALTLREYRAAEAPEEEEPEIEPPEEPDDEIDEAVGTLIVEVIVEGRPSFDFSRVTVTVEGTRADGSDLARTLTNRSENIWTEEEFPAGSYTARAVVTEPEAMSGSAAAEVEAGQTTRVTITLRPGQAIAKAFVVHFWFDRSFVEPCMRHVLRQVAEYARAHPDEKLVIVGHTDWVGDDPPVQPLYNQSLSERRGRSAYAYLTAGRDRAAALSEWNQLRRRRTIGVRRSLNDSWDTREYQHILQDLGYYPGNVDENHGSATDAAVRAFQQARGLSADGVVGDQTWQALIEAYLDQDALAVPESQFLPNCSGEILKWLGCGEQNPVRNTNDAWRPNRRSELLFVNASALPCAVPEPDTFNLPSAGAVAGGWCVGPGDRNARCCFLTRETGEAGKWLVQPAEPGSITVRGRITFADGTPLANAAYVLTAPDGEYMDGERPGGPQRGRPIPGRTDANGAFAYPDKQKGIGIYTLAIEGPYIARLAGSASTTAKGNVVCSRLDGTSDFVVVVCRAAADFTLQVDDATRIGAATSTTYMAIRAATGDVTISVVFPAGTCTAPSSIRWTGGIAVPDNPLQRRVPRSTIGQTTVTARLITTGATHAVDIFVVRVTVDVDADRDATVEEDAVGKNAWEFGVGTKGAVILCNNDDDNSNSVIDNQNAQIDGASDVDDLAPLIIRQSGPLPAGVSLSLSVTAQDKIRVFNPSNPSATAILGPAPLANEYRITSSDTSDVPFGMEATQYPDAAFDGLIRLALILRQGTSEIVRDEVLVRVAPWIMPSHLDETLELYVVETADNAAFVSEIQAIATAAGVPLQRTSNADRWMQDTMEIGYSRMPGKENNVIFKAVRARGLRRYARDNLLGPDYGYTNVVSPTADNTFDSHGNLETSPPVQAGGKNYHFGRIYYGHGRPTEPFNNEAEAFLIAQRIQKPFSIDTDWLAVGHVDEIISFVPANAGGKNFRMLFADTREAIRILNALQSAGHGSLRLFEGHAEVISVDDLLVELGGMSDGELGWANNFCQTRLDAVRAHMQTELGLSDSDIILIPALFIENPHSPRIVNPAEQPEFDALIPGMVNLLLINRPTFSDIRLVIARPFGPVLSGVDQLEQDVRSKLAPLGYAAGQLRFVDDYDTYHMNLGEVHCGTNSKRRPPARPWWEQVDF